MNVYSRYVLILLLSAVSHLICLAGDTLVLKQANVNYFSNKVENNQVEVYIDSSKTISLQQILSQEYQKKFIKGSLPSYCEDENRVVYWVKMTIENRSSSSLKWFFIQGDPSVGSIEFFAPDNSNNYSSLGKSGTSLPFYARSHNIVSPSFDLPLDSGEVKTFYLRVTTETSFLFKFVIQDHGFALNYFINEYYFFGFYYGTILLILLYNLVLFYSIRDKVYIYYSLYVLGTILLNTRNDKIAFQFLFSGYPQLNILIVYLSPSIFLIFLTLYFNGFLSVRKSFPLFYKIFNLYTVLAALFLFLDTYLINSGIDNYLLTIHFIIIYYIGIKKNMQGYAPARFFLVGFGFVFTGMLVLILTSNGFLPVNIFTVYAYNAGVVIEVIILSGALGERFKFIKESKEKTDRQLIEQLKENEQLQTKVNRELEEKIKERTQLIEMQAAEISKMNLLLQEDNKKLETNIEKISKARVVHEDITYEEFIKVYKDEDFCYKFLEDLKWGDKFSCTKCKNTSYNSCKIPYARKCTKCKKIETVTANTLLQGVKFPISKALYIVVCSYYNANKYTIEDLSGILSLRVATCWAFQDKVKKKIASVPIPKKGKINWSALIYQKNSATNKE